MFLGIVIMCIAGAVGVVRSREGGREAHPLVASVTRGTLRVVVNNRGSLESCVTVDGICELVGYQNKIIQLSPEGTRVGKGEIVCRFDSGEIERNLAQQEIRVKQGATRIETTRQEIEIARNRGEGMIIAGEVELKLAELDLKMYQKGTYRAETEKIQGYIGDMTKRLQEAEHKLEQTTTLVKKGFKSVTDQRLAKLDKEGLEITVRGLNSELMVKKNFEFERRSTEFSARGDQARKKVQQARAMLKASLAKTKSEYEVASATYDIEAKQLKEFLRQKARCIIRAGLPGIVAYANESSSDSSRQIREGAMVHSRQKIFSLPDMSRMQVTVRIHESLIRKVKSGLRAEIRVDAFPNLVVSGEVKSVAQLADSNRGGMSGDVKEYTAVVTLTNMPREELKPGMTAEAKILVGEFANVLMVPLKAVAEQSGKYYTYAKTPEGLERRGVMIGATNDKMVEIVDGVKEGETVALDTQWRAGTDEFKNEPSQESIAKLTTVATPPG